MYYDDPLYYYHVSIYLLNFAFVLLGLYAYSALNEKSIFRSLAVLGNGPERVSPYVHVLKIKNSEEVFKAYNAQNCALTKHSDQAHRPTSLTPPSASHLTFSTDLYTFVFRPHIPPFKLSEHYFFGTDNQKVNQLVKKVLEFTKKVEEKNSEIRNGLFALSEKLFWDEELDDSEILLIKKVVHEEGYHMGFLATTTAECVKRYLDELVACRAGLKRAKEELDELLTGLLELDLGKEHHVEVMKLLLVNRFGPYEFAAEEKEIEMEAVARIKFLPSFGFFYF